LEPDPFFQKYIYEKSIIAKTTTNIGLGPKVRKIVFGDNSWKFAEDAKLREILQKRVLD
jgi:hypothetical protein